VRIVAVGMPIVFTMMDIPTAFLATPMDIPKRMFTLTNQCQMSTYKAQPNGCRNEASLKRYANSTKSTKTEMSYASIISTVLESLKAAS
jgi:hypothetical protein